MQFPSFRHVLLAIAICSAASAFGARAESAPFRVVVRYDLSVTVDTSRNKKTATAVKAAKGAMSLVGGSVAAGTIEDTVSISSTAYTVSSKGKTTRVLAAVLGGDTLTRQSEGAIDGGGYMASQKFSETRGSKKRVAVNTDYPQKKATYFKNGKETKVEAVSYRIADSASMPYLFLRQPLPSSPFTVAATDGHSTKTIMLSPSDDTVEIGKQQIPALHLTRTQLSGEDASIDLWLRKDDGMPLRIRVGLDAKYGVVLEQKVAELPPVLK